MREGYTQVGRQDSELIPQATQDICIYLYGSSVHINLFHCLLYLVIGTMAFLE